MSISGGMKEFIPVLYLCENDSYIHVENPSSVMYHALKEVSFGVNLNEANPYKELFFSIESLASAANISLADKIKKIKTAGKIDAEEIDAENIERRLNLNTEEIQQLIKMQTVKLKLQTEAINREDSLIKENQKILEQLEHIGNISADLDSLFNFEFFTFRFGRMPREAYDSIAIYGIIDMDDVFFIPSSIEKQEVWGLYFTPRKRSVKVDSMFSILHFEASKISEKAHKTPEIARAELKKEIEEAKIKTDEINAELANIISEINELTDKYYEKIYLLFSIHELRKKTVQTNSSFHLFAWVPERRVEKFAKQLSKFSTVSWIVNDPFDVPAVKPPTLLKNFFLFKPFEQFVKMYGLPSYHEIDPTPFLALTYILFFGIMFADVGQGLFISLAGFLIWRIKRINLGRIVGILGLSSILWGVIFGSVFGFENIIHGYNPLEHINIVLIAAVGLGITTVSGSIIINIINGVKQKDIEKSLFTHNSLAGILFYWAVVIAALVTMKFLPLNISVTILVSVAVFCMVLIYLREPLVNIIKRKEKIIPESPVEFFISGLFELFEIVLSFLTNTISFIRVGAFALNHVGMMSVVMLLAENTSGGKNPVVIIIGNIVVIALEGLIVGIQCMRLQYYEIFGRFFDGNGKNFEPSEFSSKKFK